MYVCWFTCEFNLRMVKVTEECFSVRYNSWEVEARRSIVQGYPPLSSKFKASLGYMRPYRKKENMNSQVLCDSWLLLPRTTAQDCHPVPPCPLMLSLSCSFFSLSYCTHMYVNLHIWICWRDTAHDREHGILSESLWPCLMVYILSPSIFLPMSLILFFWR